MKQLIAHQLRELRAHYADEFDIPENVDFPVGVQGLPRRGLKSSSS